MVPTEVEHSREEETGHARARTGAGMNDMMLLANSGHFVVLSTVSQKMDIPSTHAQNLLKEIVL